MFLSLVNFGGIDYLEVVAAGLDLREGGLKVLVGGDTGILELSETVVGEKMEIAVRENLLESLLTAVGDVVLRAG